MSQTINAQNAIADARSGDDRIALQMQAQSATQGRRVGFLAAGAGLRRRRRQVTFLDFNKEKIQTQTIDALTQQMESQREYTKQQALREMESKLGASNLTFALQLFASFLLLGTFVFSLGEGWTAVEAFYFSFVTLTTIGYGDFSPTGITMRLLLALYCIVGLGVIGFCLGAVMEYVSARADAAEYDDKFTIGAFYRGITRAIVLWVVLLNIAGFIFAFSENWLIWDGVWFAFTTMTTIGYGDMGNFYKSAKLPNATAAQCAEDWKCAHTFNSTGDGTYGCSCQLSSHGKLLVIIISVLGLGAIGNILDTVSVLLQKLTQMRAELQLTHLILSRKNMADSANAGGVNPKFIEGIKNSLEESEHQKNWIKEENAKITLGSLVQMEGESWTGQVMTVRDDEGENGAPLGVVILTGEERAAKMLWCNAKVLNVVQKSDEEEKPKQVEAEESKGAAKIEVADKPQASRPEKLDTSEEADIEDMREACDKLGLTMSQLKTQADRNLDGQLTKHELKALVEQVLGERQVTPLDLAKFADDHDIRLSVLQRVATEFAGDDGLLQMRELQELHSALEAFNKDSEATSCIPAWLRHKLSHGVMGIFTQFIMRLSFVFICQIIAAVVMNGLEDWGLLNSWYFIVITTTTVGYGDFYPVTVAGRLATMAFAIVGLGVTVNNLSWLGDIRDEILLKVSDCIYASFCKAHWFRDSEQFILSHMTRASPHEIARAQERDAMTRKLLAAAHAGSNKVSPMADGHSDAKLPESMDDTEGTPVFMLDTEGRIIFWSHVAEKLTGRSENEVRSKPLRKFVRRSTGSEVSKLVGEAVKNPSVTFKQKVIHFLHKDADKFIEAGHAPAADAKMFTRGMALNCSAVKGRHNKESKVIGVVGREKRLASDKTDRILLAEAIANMLVSFLYCSFGGVIYMLNVPYESRPSLPDITYYAFVTVTTVGYGDLTPSTDFEKVYICVWMMFGLVLMAGLLDTVSKMVLNDQDERMAEVRGECLTELSKLDEHVETIQHHQEELSKALFDQFGDLTPEQLLQMKAAYEHEHELGDGYDSSESEGEAIAPSMTAPPSTQRQPQKLGGPPGRSASAAAGLGKQMAVMMKAIDALRKTSAQQQAKIVAIEKQLK